MGNCLEMSRNMSEDQEEQNPQTEEIKNNNGDVRKRRRRIKVVLTKEELEWLMIQLEQDKRKLEDVLGEIERCRAKFVQLPSPWKPSLQSIMEISNEARMER